jgi:hypothetical protein
LHLSEIVKELKAERSRLDAAINALEGVSSNGAGPRKRGTMSLAGRRRIAAAQRARWAKFKKANKRD